MLIGAGQGKRHQEQTANFYALCGSLYILGPLSMLCTYEWVISGSAIGARILGRTSSSYNVVVVGGRGGGQ